MSGVPRVDRDHQGRDRFAPFGICAPHHGRIGHPGMLPQSCLDGLGPDLLRSGDYHVVRAAVDPQAAIAG